MRTIALLTTGFWHHFSRELFEGVQEEAKRLNLTLVALPGNELESRTGYVDHPAMANQVYDLIKPETFDGLVIWTGALGNFVTQEKLEDFLDQWRTPLICIGRKVRGHPSVGGNVELSTRRVLEHLIVHHGCRRLLFVRGPKDHEGCERRFATYRQVLWDYGLPYDRKLVLEPLGGWAEIYDHFRYYLDQPGRTQATGSRAREHTILTSLSERGLVPVRDFDAVVAATDMLAAIAVRQLQDIGYQVPADVAVVGLDGDPSAGQILAQGLTTTDMRMHSLGARAVAILEGLMEGRAIAALQDEDGVPTLRTSCGCPPSEPELETGALPPTIRTRLDEALQTPAPQRDQAFLNQWRRGLLLEPPSPDGGNASWLKYLWGAGGSLSPEATSQAEAWHRRVSREQSEFVRNTKRRQTALLLEIAQNLSVRFDLNELGRALETNLPLLGISSFCLSLYINPKVPLEGLRAQFAFQGGEKLDLSSVVAPVPPGFFGENAGCFVAVPLFFSQDHLGVGFFEYPDHLDPEIYQNLGTQIATALKGARLSLEITEKMESLRTAQANLQEREKLAVLGGLAAGVAHEINTPLGAIVSSNGLVGTLADSLPDIVASAAPALTAAEVGALKGVLVQAGGQNSILSSQEARTLRRALVKELSTAEEMGASAEEQADFLAEFGFTKVPEAWWVLAQARADGALFHLLRALADIRRASSIVALASTKMTDYVLAIRRYIHREHDRPLRSPVDVCETIETVLLINSGRLKGGIVLERQFHDRPRVLGWHEDLIHLWSNLVMNAVQAMNDQGKLGVTVEVSRKWAVVSISDSGHGISPEDRERIFQDFYTTKPLGEGTGLGLGIVRQIVAEHHGKVEVDSVPGKTTFRVKLPVLDESRVR